MSLDVNAMKRRERRWKGEKKGGRRAADERQRQQAGSRGVGRKIGNLVRD